MPIPKRKGLVGSDQIRYRGSGTLQLYFYTQWSSPREELRCHCPMMSCSYGALRYNYVALLPQGYANITKERSTWVVWCQYASMSSFRKNNHWWRERMVSKRRQAIILFKDTLPYSSPCITRTWGWSLFTAMWRHDLWLASICDCGTICDHIMLQFVTRHDLWPKVLQFVTSVIQWF